MNVHDSNGQVFISRHGFQLILYRRDSAKGATLYGCGGRVCNMYLRRGCRKECIQVNSLWIQGLQRVRSRKRYQVEGASVRYGHVCKPLVPIQCLYIAPSNITFRGVLYIVRNRSSLLRPLHLIGIPKGTRNIDTRETTKCLVGKIFSYRRKSANIIDKNVSKQVTQSKIANKTRRIYITQTLKY